MKVSFLGAAHEVTGSCSLLEVAGKKIMIDCGMEQGADIYENCELPVSPSDIDCLLLTHAHIDHSGKIPALAANGFDGPVFCSEPTKKLCNIMLLDSAHIQEFEAEWRNRKAKRSGREEYVPLYTSDDVRKAMEQFVGCVYEKEYDIFDGIKIKFFDAGHLLGSASIKITFREDGDEKTIVFSGDVGNIGRPLICDYKCPDKADYVVIESTYGNRLHEEKPDYIGQLINVFQRTFDRGGNVVIPSFAVGRTQELLYLIRIIKEKGLIKGHENFPVFVDSPLAVEATGIYSDSEMKPYYDEETLSLLDKGITPIRFPNLNLSVTSDDSIKINLDKTPKIILSASGMCEAGRIRHHLKHNLWRRDSTILFVGYQTEGTVGRLLLDGADTVKLFGEEIKVNAEIAQISGMSGHADRSMLLDWIDGFSEYPQKIFVNHGNDTVCDEFAESITERFGIEATAPYNGAEYDLLTGECLYEGNRVKKEPKVFSIKSKRTSFVYDKLLAAGRRLMSVIEKNKEGANKDLAKFRDQIIALCDKWDR